MARICPLCKTPCIGPDCYGYTAEYRFGKDVPGPDGAAVYMDTASEKDWNTTGKLVPCCKLFGVLPVEDKNGRT